MGENTVDAYIRWITPTPGDPTYSLLKAHLIFEELLRAYLAHQLPYASALDGARLTFAQLLAVARACSPNVSPDHWVWKAIGDLNRLRNMLSHEAQPKALRERLNEYVKFVEDSLQYPVPDSNIVAGTPEAKQAPGHLYSAVDLVTVGLYYSTALALGFDIEEVTRDQDSRTKAMVQASSEAEKESNANGVSDAG